MNAVEIRVLRLPHAADLPMPTYHSALAAGFDLAAAVPRAVLICWPGGSYARAYWDMHIAGYPGYSFAEHMTAQGFAVVGADHLGVGASSKPAEGDFLTRATTAAGSSLAISNGESSGNRAWSRPRSTRPSHVRPPVGPSIPLSQLGSTILSVMQIVGLERLDRVDPTFIRAYGAAFPTPADCKGAIEFPLDLALGRIRDFVREGAGGVAAIREKPALMVEGMLDRAIPPALALADFARLWPNAPVVRVPGAGHYIQEGAPEVVVPALQTFLGMLA